MILLNADGFFSDNRSQLGGKALDFRQQQLLSLHDAANCALSRLVILLGSGFKQCNAQRRSSWNVPCPLVVLGAMATPALLFGSCRLQVDGKD